MARQSRFAMLAPAALLAVLSSPVKALRKFSRDRAAALNLNAGLTIVGVIIGAVVTIAIVAALFPTFLSSVADINGQFNDPNTTTNDTTADGLLSIFPILIGLGALFAIVGIILAAVAIKRKGM